MTHPIVVDGALGEGGGQVLRSALSLSLLTGEPLRLSRIRANRERPGLRPQHLAAVQAAAQVSGARVSGDRVGSREIAFAPRPVRPGDYLFDIGTAGAASLVLQTLLLPLALAAGGSCVTIRGGTHVPWSPCFHYLHWHWRPVLHRLGIPFDLTMTTAGFYPEGGGELQARIPGGARPAPLHLTERGALRAVRGLSAVANLPREIAERQPRNDPRAPCACKAEAAIGEWDSTGGATMSDPSEQDARTEEAPFIRVECYAGHRADTEPRRLHIGGRAVTVMQIIDRWLDPRHRYFKLRGDDGGIYLIRHDTASDRWDLTLFDSGRHDATRLSST